MPNNPDRRRTLALLAATGAAVLLPTVLTPGAARAEPVLGDIVMGEAAAPVTIIEYASFTCPHCAAFAVETFPQVKQAYIDTGKARYILREVYFDKYGLWASMTARCGGEAAFYPMADQFLKKQKVWTGVSPDQIPAEIKKIGRLNGLSDAQFNACLSDSDYARTLVDTYKANATADGVTATPTFLINGEKASGEMSFEAFSALIEKHL